MNHLMFFYKIILKNFTIYILLNNTFMKDARLQKEKCRFSIRKSVLFYEKTYAFLKPFFSLIFLVCLLLF